MHFRQCFFKFSKHASRSFLRNRFQGWLRICSLYINRIKTVATKKNGGQIFIRGNKKKLLHGVISGEYGGCGGLFWWFFLLSLLSITSRESKKVVNGTYIWQKFYCRKKIWCTFFVLINTNFEKSSKWCFSSIKKKYIFRRL